MKLFIPTKSRHRDQVTLSFMPSNLKDKTTLVVAASEEEDYKVVHDNILVVPEDVSAAPIHLVYSVPTVNPVLTKET